MKSDLETLLRANPFVPFVTTLRSGEALFVGSDKRMMLGTDAFCYLDPWGAFRIVPYADVERLAATHTPAGYGP